MTGDHEVEIWGDGAQTRSFSYIDHCVTGLYKLMQSNYSDPPESRAGSAHYDQRVG